MRGLIALIALLLSAQAWAVSPCYWAGVYVKCFPAAGADLTSILISGASGAGYIDFLGQAAEPSAPSASHGRLSSTDGTSLSFLNSSGGSAILGFSNVLGTDRTYTFPDSSANVILDTTTQTLTNKVINAALNTVTNVSLTGGITGVLLTNNGGTGQNSSATFPTSGVLITRTSADQGANLLTLKDLSATSVVFVDPSDTTKKIKFNAAGATGSTTSTIVSLASTNRTINLPDADTTIVGTDVTQALTNKTLSSPVLTTPTITTPTVLAGGDLRLNNAGNTFYTGFKGGNAAANKIWTLPLVDGSTGQVLKTDGSATLGWVSAATNPFTTTGDIMYSSDNSGTPARLAIGAAGTVLKGGTIPSYASIVNADVDAAAAIAGSKIVAATTSVAGAVTTSAQSFTGDKTFTASSGDNNLYSTATSTTGAARVAIKSGDGTTSSEFSYVTAESLETTTPVRWDAGIYGSKHWKLVEQSNSSKLAIDVANAGGGVSILGTPTNDNAAAGYVGEYFQNNRSTSLNVASAGSTTSFSIDTGNTSVNDGNETGIVLTAGDWDIEGTFYLVTANVTLLTEIEVWIGTAKGNSITGRVVSTNYGALGLTAISSTLSWVVPTPVYRVSITSNTTYYLKGALTFTSAVTANAQGIIRARRIR